MATTTDVTTTERTQVGRNTLASATYFVANAAFALWLVPFLVERIGVEGYGLVVLGLSLTAYIGLVAGSVNTSISRFLTIDIKQHDFSRANETFSTAFFGALAGIVLLIPFIWLLADNVALFVNVPQDYAGSAPAFIILIALAAVITFLKNIFTVPAFAQNRLDLIFLCQAVDLLTKLLVLVTLMTLLRPDVSLVGSAVVSGALGAMLASLFVWRFLAPYLKLSPARFRRSRFSELFTMSTWVIVNSTGALLFLNVDLITANLIVGVAASGQYGAIMQIVIALRSASTLISRLVAPLIFDRFAKGDEQGLTTLLARSSKFMGIMIACPVGIACAWSEEFLGLWLGPDFTHLKWLVIILTIHLAANLSCQPLFFLQQAANRVKQPAIVTLAFGLTHIALSIALAWGLDWGLYGIAASGALTLTAKNCGYTIWYSAKILNRPVSTFVLPLTTTIFCTVLSLSLGELSSLVFGVDSWTVLVLAVAGNALLYLAFVWTVMLGEDDRTFIRTNVFA
jgi:membrane protein EpsK